ncbi:HigA family addiction module antitoxin [Azospirillum sp. TSO5]|uniref:HigA family addiction module antitoxin n=1 Tax=Azospirillum sp. TSO5 TaxID=716760 RepID=UPI0018EEB845|nr:HigA family addiction module antitoxin [Azospirillum sp. TSO5]
MTDTPLKRGLPPLHPGALLREDILPSLGISVSSFAAHLRLSRQMLHRILSEEAPVTPAMALRLGKLC